MRRSTKWRLAFGFGVPAALVALAVGGYWLIDPVRVIKRDLAALRMPPGIELTDEDIQDNGLLCIDSCSEGTRYYVTTLPPEQTAEAVAAAVRDRGYTAEVRRCEHECTYANWAPYHISAYSWEVTIRGSRLDGYAMVGTRIDGRPGLDVTLHK